MSQIKYKVVILESAERDLQNIYDFVFDSDGERRANSVLSKLRSAVLSLERMPEKCPVLELKIKESLNCRKLTRNPFNILFRIRDGSVIVYAVFDVRRDYRYVLNQ